MSKSKKPKKRFISILIIFVIGLFTLLISIATNIATSIIPKQYTDYLWISWPALVLLFIGISILTIWQYHLEESANLVQASDLYSINRTRIIEKVYSYWISTILETARHEGQLINIQMEDAFEQVHNPLTQLQQPIYAPRKSISIDKTITDVFIDEGGELLILGKPGSGKSVSLLIIAASLLEEARTYKSAALPIVLNLNSWDERYKSFYSWIISELKVRYQIPLDFGEYLIQNNSIILLLDGLDRVLPDSRGSCVNAINNFRGEYGLIKIAICCRESAYSQIAPKLLLKGAIKLRPLTKEQINNYISQRIDKSYHHIILRNKRIQNFLNNPLFLALTVVVLDDLYSQGDVILTIKKYRQVLFKTYIEKALQELEQNKRHYKPELANVWLKWLSKRMREKGRSPFYIEDIQPSWLNSETQRRIYIAIILILGGTVFGFIGELIFAFIIGSIGIWAFTLRIFSGILLFIGIISGTNILIEVNTVDIVSWSWKNAFLALVKYSYKTFFVGFIAGFIIIFLLSQNEIGADTIVKGLTLGLICPLLFRVRFAMPTILNAGLKRYEVRENTTSNQGIWRSIKNAVLVTLPYSLIVASLMGLAIFLFLGALTGFQKDIQTNILSFAVGIGLFVGFRAGIIVALGTGALAFIQHGILRLLLYLDKSIPFNLIEFLDSVSEVEILQKVGGGYMFIHDSLLDYYAEKE